MSQPDAPSDVGLAGERTSLAWTRMGLTLMGIPPALLTFFPHRSIVATAAAVFAGGLALALLVTSLRRQRATPGMLEHGGPQVAAAQVALTASSVLGLCLAGFVLLF